MRAGARQVVVDLKTAITLKPEARTKWLSKAGGSSVSVPRDFSRSRGLCNGGAGQGQADGPL